MKRGLLLVGLLVSARAGAQAVPMATSVTSIGASWADCKARITTAFSANGYGGLSDFGGGYVAFGRGHSASITCVRGAGETVVVVVASGRWAESQRDRLAAGMRDPAPAVVYPAPPSYPPPPPVYQQPPPTYQPPPPAYQPPPPQPAWGACRMIRPTQQAYATNQMVTAQWWNVPANVTWYGIAEAGTEPNSYWSSCWQWINDQRPNGQGNTCVLTRPGNYLLRIFDNNNKRVDECPLTVRAGNIY